MLQRIAGAIILLGGSTTIVNAQDSIPAECLKKSGAFGAEVPGAQVFDQTSTIVNALNPSFTPLKYDLCLDLQDGNHLQSVTFTYANDDGTNQFTLPRVGPKGDDCMLIDFDRRTGAYYKATVYYDDKGVTSFMAFYDTQEFVFFSQPEPQSDNYETYDFLDGEELVGFYGLQNSELISRLGFIIKDTKCVAEKNGTPLPDNNNNNGGDGTQNQNGEGDGTTTPADGTMTDPDDSGTSNGQEQNFASNPEAGQVGVSSRGADPEVSFKSREGDVDPTGADFRSRDVDEKVEQDDGVLIAIVIIIVVSILLALAVLGIVHLLTKRRALNINKVQVMGSSQPQTANNSNTMAQQSDDDEMRIDTKRGLNQGTLPTDA